MNLDQLRSWADTSSGRDWARRAVWVVVVGALLAFVVRGATRPEDPYFEGSTVDAAESVSETSSSGRAPIEGFGEIAFTSTTPAGVVAEWCALLADTPELRAQGLMRQESLGGYDAMVFRFDEPGTGGFWMKNTIIPLTVGYFDETGRFVSSADMQPCPPDVEDCPDYPPDGPYVTAVEVPIGGLGAVGLGPGSIIAFEGNGCGGAAA
ncbi:MAG TPA: DUF192 domain-containing protein [Acidimicrobiales bacterium]|nr:DUF192 domain-containing protein [Acidimicrobiales bacterium]